MSAMGPASALKRQGWDCSLHTHSDPQWALESICGLGPGARLGISWLVCAGRWRNMGADEWARTGRRGGGGDERVPPFNAQL